MDDWLLDGSTSGKWRDMVMEDYPLANPEWFVLSTEEQARILEMCRVAAGGAAPNTGVRAWEISVEGCPAKMFCTTHYDHALRELIDCETGSFGEVTGKSAGLHQLHCSACGAALNLRLTIPGCYDAMDLFKVRRFVTDSPYDCRLLMKVIDKIGMGYPTDAPLYNKLHRLCRNILIQLDNPAP